jgi:hypothetical protein
VNAPIAVRRTSKLRSSLTRCRLGHNSR